MSPKEDKGNKHPSEKKKSILALILMLTYAALLVMASQLSSLAFLDAKINFRAPMLFMCIKLCFRALTFPMYLLLNTIAKLIKRRRIDIRRTLRYCIPLKYFDRFHNFL